MLKKVIILYIKEQRITLSLDFDHLALLIMDVFKDQMTESVRELVNESHILLEKVPESLTYFFQSLDVQGDPNGYLKGFMKKKNMLWYADQVMRVLDDIAKT